MAVRAEDEADRRDILAAVTAASRDDLRPIIEQVLEHVPTQDLRERESRDLLGAVDSLHQLAQQRTAGQLKVRVWSPTLAADGWTSRRSVLQVCTRDAPFLVDSVIAAITKRGLATDLIVHPIMSVQRDGDGVLLTSGTHVPAPEVSESESWMHIEMDRLGAPPAEQDLQEAVRAVLTDVHAAHEDWPAMRQACEAIAANLDRRCPASIATTQIESTKRFLRWLAQDHFTFIGYREYTLDQVEIDGVSESVLRPVPGSGLGVQRHNRQGYSRLRPQAQRTALEPRLLTVTKANSRSTVHRPVYLDYIGIRTFDAHGNVTGEQRILGLFTATVYADSVTRLPLAGDKVAAVIARSGFEARSHSGKALTQILQTYPRDELFSTSIETLTAICLEVLVLAQRRRAQLFIRTDEFGRYASVLVYVPRERYSTDVRLRIETMLRQLFDTDNIEHSIYLGDEALAQVHLVIRVDAGQALPTVKLGTVRTLVLAAISTWDDQLADHAHASATDPSTAEQVAHLLAHYTFPEAYKEDVEPADAVADLFRLDSLAVTGTGSVHLEGTSSSRRRFTIFSATALSLTHVLPLLTNLGVEVLDERPYRIASAGGHLHIYAFGLRADRDLWPTDGSAFEEAFIAVWTGAAESDLLNSLVLVGGLTWRQIVVLRAIGRYLRQIGSTFSMEYIEQTLVANPALAAGVVRLFELRFDPDAGLDLRLAACRAQLEHLQAQLEQTSLDADRILRSFIGVVQATQRTNFFQLQADGSPKPHVAMKLDCHQVPDLPLPHPMAEIWVYSPRVEGIHLRFGKIARGGLRWSDRREDFRTEVLGLVKAQMVKNAVIVPTGSKGGFVGKQLPDLGEPDAWLAAGKAAYRTFIRALLDVTDNRAGSQIVGPDRVVRHDGDDPYLVVAADKGTASFSDIANEIAGEYEFWLGDAFASGGSVGYDHKAMGITARGAWESVKRHFRELGIDCQREDITVVGIGDMSGDVFGNGMLLSKHLALVAAFDHRHIFLDPDPDIAASFAERRRLFQLPTSSWADYDSTLVSIGGGVFSRSAKSVPLSPQVRDRLGITDEITALTPAELINRILQAPADLLWNGGIGTYIKSSDQTHGEVGDRGNDSIRVDGAQLRVRVVGEGGNLGATQLGRIEAATAGVQINTDAIDNSAGVGTSDREVNIKIALNPGRAGTKRVPQRADLLSSMTDEVARQVLRDNYEQNVLLGNSRANSATMLPVHRRFIGWLEDRGVLDRELEFLPSNTDIKHRIAAGEGLTRPEFAVLIAYAKLALKADLADSDLAADPWFAHTLADYFPAPLRQRFPQALAEHPLRHEIIVNSVVNSMVNRGGITFSFRAADETGASSEQIARAYVAAREIFGLQSFTQAVEATDNLVSTGAQTELYLTFRRILDRASRWLVRGRMDQLDIAAAVERYAPAVTTWGSRMADLHQGVDLQVHQQRAARLEQAGFDSEFARRGAGLLATLSLLDIVEFAGPDLGDIEDVARLYYALSPVIGFGKLMDQVNDLPQDDRWDSLARAALRDDLVSVTIDLTRSLRTRTSAEASPGQRIEQWLDGGGDTSSRAMAALAAVHAVDEPGIAAMNVALRALRSLGA
ncbi:MAG: NAD-glutamate dehydrogenase [Beutenbergiaceae bacterium]